MILIELMVAMAVAAFLLLLLPFLLLVAGIAGAVMLWYVAPVVLVTAVILWLVLPGGHGLAILLLLLFIGFVLIERRSRHRAF